MDRYKRFQKHYEKKEEVANSKLAVLTEWITDPESITNLERNLDRLKSHVASKTPNYFAKSDTLFHFLSVDIDYFLADYHLALVRKELRDVLTDKRAPTPSMHILDEEKPYEYEGKEVNDWNMPFFFLVRRNPDYNRVLPESESNTKVVSLGATIDSLTEREMEEMYESRFKRWRPKKSL